MSEHWYKNGVLADQRHADWPKTKAGTPRVSPPKAMMVGLGFKPSVTSILSVVGGAGGLLNWYAKMGMQAALNVGREKLGWKEELKKLTSAAAEEGTRFHKCIEEYLSGYNLPEDAPAKSACINVHNWITSRKLTGGRKEHIVELEEHPLGREIPYAGTVDYWIEKEGELWVIDIKTKNTAKDCRPEWAHVAQCAAYAHAIDSQKKVEDVRCVNLYISRETGELGKAKVWTEEEMEIGMELFGHASWVWKTMNTNKIT